MKKLIALIAVFCFLVPAHAAESGKLKVLSVIVEQRITGDPTAWWVGGTDLSVLEAACAEGLAQHGVDVVKPAAVKGLMKEAGMKPVMYPRDCALKNLAGLAGARYILRGRALVSKGVRKKTLPSGQYVGVTTALVDVATGKTVTRIDVWGHAPTRDAAGVDAALRDAGKNLAMRVVRSFAGKGE